MTPTPGSSRRVPSGAPESNARESTCGGRAADRVEERLVSEVAHVSLLDEVDEPGACLREFGAVGLVRAQPGLLVDALGEERLRLVADDGVRVMVEDELLQPLGDPAGAVGVVAHLDVVDAVHAFPGDRDRRAPPVGADVESDHDRRHRPRGRVGERVPLVEVYDGGGAAVEVGPVADVAVLGRE